MNQLLRFGTLLACLGFAVPALAQTSDDLPVPADSTNCRAVVGQADIDGTTQQIVGRACLQSDGTWQIVQGQDGSVLWYPVADYPYLDPWWWGPPVFIGAGVSLIFVDRFHHFHHFDHYHLMDRGRFRVPVGAGFHRGGFGGGGARGFGGAHSFGGAHGFGGMGRR